MDMNDALSTCKMTGAELMSLVNSLAQKKLQEEVTGDARYDGFIVRADGSVDIFYTVVTGEGTDGIGRLVAYNSETKDIRIVFEEGDVIPAEECDNLKPILTHGRKEQ